VTCAVYSHPIPSHRKPGKQHPPLGASGQELYPAAVLQLILPAHIWPWGQHPTEPTPGLLLTLMHMLPVPQQTSGAPIKPQLLVPVGHANCRLSSAALMRSPERKLSSVKGRSGDCASHVPFPSSSCLDVALRSEANIQLSNMNISPSSVLIFRTPTGFSCCNFCLSSNPLFTRISSSGKYFRCLGRLCGHCGSAHEVVAHSRMRKVGGSARRFVSCISKCLRQCVLGCMQTVDAEDGYLQS
jgi:hypothetical protein